MNGIHDMGGLHGFGNVEVEHDEPVFHSHWESRVFCITQALDATGVWNLDEHRHEIEKMGPVDYLSGGYYGRWLYAMEHLLDQKRILCQAEVEQRITEHALGERVRTPPAMKDRAWPLTESTRVRWGAWRKEESVVPRFRVGDTVRVRNLHPAGHTRVTAYTRGHIGVIAKVNPQAWVFPDTRAHYRGERLQAVYNVRFTSVELWGDQAEDDVFLHIDLSEDHLELLVEQPYESR